MFCKGTEGISKQPCLEAVIQVQGSSMQFAVHSFSLVVFTIGT